ncbi:hypothetical protein [Sphingomonas bacterium]|nr:hypothetical protein [Sphingomonas bacterium]
MDRGDDELAVIGERAQARDRLDRVATTSPFSPLSVGGAPSG